jgi:hypothetical protein
MDELHNVSAADALRTLGQLGSNPMSGVYLRPPAGDDVVGRMQMAACRDLGEPVPEDYITFLRVTNGVQINGAYFKSAEDLVPENLDVPRPELIVLGNEGNMVELVFDRRDRRYYTIAMGSLGERFADYDSFGELLADILREQQVL